MAVAKISFAASALGDLEEIQAWYAEEGVPEVGDRFVAEIFERVEVLADHPDIGRVVPEFGQPFLRELIHPPFRIVYRRDAQRVRIVRIWRSERMLRLPPSATSQDPSE
ncbi:MAG: type II toxin-antitoxin system RelE/ParE family toxin [Pseudomonadota bacterium]|nr:type II toxin-antitoxin system RelE/ParE family toxin [Pseudomonadota bacterium]